MNPRTPALAFASIALLAALTACAPQPEIAPTTTPSPTSGTEPASTPSPEPTPSDAAEEPAADPTCETLIAPSTIEIFEEHGWTYREDEFRVGADVIEGGLQCVWGDYTVASDHVQVFGWAPLPADESAAAQQKLLSEGWARADKDDHTYITEDPQFAIAVDEAGYGMTYEFGDGWVTLADTMQSLVLIERP
ncbi:hypothetical protein MZK47_01505 [Microbacterium aerolatum]|uniref:hypothetical protein n=1 Tax=Microbacterium aerolatum TaxID=153731 RepID=UPI002000F3AD|nr:hypothetical protein [Microbacterium aerolatum]MCK3768348.1 hypothetical protein [Microbacterium aerolatum]